MSPGLTTGTQLGPRGARLPSRSDRLVRTHERSFLAIRSNIPVREPSKPRSFDLSADPFMGFKTWICVFSTMSTRSKKSVKRRENYPTLEMNPKIAAMAFPFVSEWQLDWRPGEGSLYQLVSLSAIPT